jgi:hypothetical protein
MEKKRDDIDRLIKKVLAESDYGAAPSFGHCPSERELSDYLEGRLDSERENVLLEHLAECSHCLSLLVLAEESLRDMEGIAPSRKMIMRAKNILRKDTKSPKNLILRYRWQFLAFISFALSFAFSRYFLQFLVIGAVFALKWVFDTASRRTLIMIYDAWRRKDRSEIDRILGNFEDKIEQRR